MTLHRYKQARGLPLCRLLAIFLILMVARHIDFCAGDVPKDFFLGGTERQHTETPLVPRNPGNLKGDPVGTGSQPEPESSDDQTPSSGGSPLPKEEPKYGLIIGLSLGGAFLVFSSFACWYFFWYKKHLALQAAKAMAMDEEAQNPDSSPPTDDHRLSLDKEGDPNYWEDGTDVEDLDDHHVYALSSTSPVQNEMHDLSTAHHPTSATGFPSFSSDGSTDAVLTEYSGSHSISLSAHDTLHSHAGPEHDARQFHSRMMRDDAFVQSPCYTTPNYPSRVRPGSPLSIASDIVGSKSQHVASDSHSCGPKPKRCPSPDPIRSTEYALTKPQKGARRSIVAPSPHNGPIKASPDSQTEERKDSNDSLALYLAMDMI